MVKFQLHLAGSRLARRGATRAKKLRPAGIGMMSKSLIKCRRLKFEQKLRLIRFYFGQKRRFIANASFNPVC
jgi:hypothetical protein